MYLLPLVISLAPATFFPAPQQIKQLFVSLLSLFSHPHLLNPLNLLFHAPLVNLSYSYRQANPQLCVLLGLISAANVKEAYMLGRPIPPPVLPEKNSLLQLLLIIALIFNVLQTSKCIHLSIFVVVCFSTIFSEIPSVTELRSVHQVSPMC